MSLENLSRRSMMTAAVSVVTAAAVPALATPAATPAASAGQVICESGASDNQITALAGRAIELSNAHEAACEASNPPEKKYLEWRGGIRSRAMTLLSESGTAAAMPSAEPAFVRPRLQGTTPATLPRTQSKPLSLHVRAHSPDWRSRQRQ